jgi:hypothetical protein
MRVPRLRRFARHGRGAERPPLVCSRTDALGERVEVVDYGPGQFSGEVSQLSGRPPLVDGMAVGELDALVLDAASIRALLMAEAELGERLMRAFILRRVLLIGDHPGGPILIGPPAHAGLFELENFLSRNAYPYTRRDPAHGPGSGAAGARALARCVRLAAGGAARRLRDAQPEPGGAGALPRHLAAHRPRQGVRRAGGGRRPVRPGDRRVRGLRRLVGDGAGPARLRRPGRRQRAHRELPRLPDRHLGPRAGRALLCAGDQVRRRGGDPGPAAACCATSGR